MIFQDKLLAWYDLNHRKLPFRQSHDPYNIWVSEIMLQQTKMDTVLPYYERFMAAFPSVFELAKASEHEVMKLWQGLGYYSRARNLLKCAKAIVNEHEGQFPTTYKSALKLPGIGPYTAGAILSIAYNQKIPAVDGNVMRVLSRFFNIQLDIAIPKNKKLFEQKAKQIMPERTGDFNQALMELGALICVPKNPKCTTCPLNNSCLANQLCLQSLLPIKRAKAKPVKIPIGVGIVRRENTILMTKTSTGLLQGLWGFPVSEGESKTIAKENLINSLRKDFNLEIKTVREIGKEKHVFTHKIWLITLYEVHTHTTLNEKLSPYPVNEELRDDEKKVWVCMDSLNDYPMAKAFKKLAKYL